jgi:transposase-like protein
MRLVNSYVDRLEPQLGAVWHVDEMKVKNGGQWSCLWNVMDEETRFMLVSTISKTPRAQHIWKPRFVDPTNNNMVERLNGTVREREKVMRGMKSDETAEELMSGLRTYYNFIRPHQSLNGKTLAEKAGIDLQLGENKWYGLMKKTSCSPPFFPAPRRGLP